MATTTSGIEEGGEEGEREAFGSRISVVVLRRWSGCVVWRVVAVRRER